MTVDHPLVPKSADGVLWALVVGRVSTEKQAITNIEAGYRYVDEALRRLWDGPVHIKRLGEQGSGMLTERATIVEAIEEIATKRWDVCLMEDLSKVYRNPRWQYAFVQDAVDAGTRVIIPGDHVDTADENWEVAIGAAALRHGLHIPDTRRRVRRTAVDSFHRGGMVCKIRFGYRKLTKEEAQSGQFGPPGLRVAKVPENTPIIKEMARRILAGETSMKVARWLNREEIPPGPYVTTKRWTSKLVEALLNDPILTGFRRHRQVILTPIFKTGKHRRSKNDNPEMKRWECLAHLTDAEGAALQAELTRRLAPRSAGQPAKRRGLARTQSIWPGQAANCAVCGGNMYDMGGHLKCQNCLRDAAEPCWNHVQAKCELAREKFIGWLVKAIDSVPGCRAVLIDTAWKELEERQRRRMLLVDSSTKQIATLEKQAASLAEAIALGGELPPLIKKLTEVQAALEKARQRTKGQVNHSSNTGEMSKEEIDRNLTEVLLDLARTSYEFADLVRRITVNFVIVPVQALDTPLVRARAKLTIRLSNLLGPHAVHDTTQDLEVVLDFFDPPVHIEHLADCLALKQENPKLSGQKIAVKLGINHMTVKRALDYAKLMARAGLTEPYRELHERPDKASRWLRRKAS